MANAILVDFDSPDNWEFASTLASQTKEKWQVLKFISNRNHGSIGQNIWRAIKYFYFPFKIFCQRKKYHRIIAWQQFYGLILAFYLKFFRVTKAPEIIVMTFIYKDKQGLLGRLYKRFVRYAITSSHIKYLVVFSKAEPEYYAHIFNLPKEKFRAMRLGIEDVEGQYDIRDEKYYLAAGRSNRDYDFLVSAWKDKEYKCEIICDSYKRASSSPGVLIKTNCHGEAYFKKLAGCHGVIIPLANKKISSGQLVILQAMMLGKPIIVTTNDSIADYLIDGQAGFVIEKKAKALDKALAEMKNPITYNELSVSARRCFEQYFTLAIMARKVSELIH